MGSFDSLWRTEWCSPDGVLAIHISFSLIDAFLLDLFLLYSNFITFFSFTFIIICRYDLVVFT